MLKGLLEHIARSLVASPDKVSVEEEKDGTTVILRLYVDSADMGKVIGRQGRTAKAIRAVIKAAAVKENVRAVVDII